MMNRTACLLLATSLVAPLTGCVVRAEVEPLVRYEGTPASQSVPYNSGLPVRIISTNGNVEVVRGGATDVEVTFSPFTLGEEGAEEAAKREMENPDLLNLSIGGAGFIEIAVAKGEGASSGLGADILVRLPSVFDSDFEVQQNNGGTDVDLSGTSASSTTIASNNGSIDLSGARGNLSVATENGSADVDVDTWGAQDGFVTASSDIQFAVPSDVNGTIQATVDPDFGQVIDPSPLPATWVTAGESPAKSYTMGTGMGGNVELSTVLGDITIIAK
jgi:hypothetical protein